MASQLVLYPADALRTLAQTRTGAMKTCAKSPRELGPNALDLWRPDDHWLCLPHWRAAVCCFWYCSAGGHQARLVTDIYASFRVAVGTIWSAQGLRGFLPTLSGAL